MAKSEVKQLGDHKSAVAITFTQKELNEKCQKVIDVLQSCTHGPHEALAVVKTVEKFLSERLGVVAAYQGGNVQ